MDPSSFTPKSVRCAASRSPSSAASWKATGHVTWAEIPPDPADYPGADPALLVPGSLVFQRAQEPVDLRDHRNWWTWVPGAQWRHPEGPGSTVHGRELHPVTHVAHEDAIAYALWAGKQLPTEAQWERAARGGLEGKTFCWGDEFAPRGKMMANTWQCEFPWENQLLDGYERTSPVKQFAPNSYGLYDMAGNVWEWTADPFSPGHSESRLPCCVPESDRHDPGEKSPHASSRAARTCARPTTACATARRRARASPSTRRRATSGSAASSARGDAAAGRSVTAYDGRSWETGGRSRSPPAARAALEHSDHLDREALVQRVGSEIHRHGALPFRIGARLRRLVGLGHMRSAWARVMPSLRPGARIDPRRRLSRRPSGVPAAAFSPPFAPSVRSHRIGASNLRPWRYIVHGRSVGPCDPCSLD